MGIEIVLKNAGEPTSLCLEVIRTPKPQKYNQGKDDLFCRCPAGSFWSIYIGVIV